ncbi:hydroxyacylglutathione hydrolase [Kineobactrum sediminis]|uniref:Hydroxyacylglutathione hydrolase n=1 Tax=Kineobactrum sediminis TaxID=1905677 RepID=A0A2N5Y137_9GAMM|nr:hydroxyacylglutathione hydrolase [Kineobactrum sediminis]PLW82106.1 hydroxyacylglutathione hydrolase [Kineobactrum sediminis]
MLTIEPIRAFSDNYIWLLTDTANNHCFVVDPGDAEPVLEVLAERQLTLAGILVTHHHFDHVGGLPLLREHTSAVVYGPHNPAIEGVDHRLAEGDTLTVLGLEFSVLAVPGHTMDHIAYYCAGDSEQPPLLFCGDTLFAGGCGRMFEGTAPVLHGSLAKLAALPGSTRVYCAHEYTQANLRFARAVEPDNEALAERAREVAALRATDDPTVPSELAQERATNPFLRCAEPAVAATLHSQGKWQGEKPEEVFAALRTWKDSF